MSWHRSKRIAKHGLKWLNWTILLPSLCLMLLAVFLLYTAPGLSLTLWLAQKTVPGLHIKHNEGSLLGGNTLRGVEYQQDVIQLNIEQIELDINNSCLLNLSFCANKLLLSGVDFKLVETEQASEQTETDSAMPGLWLPFPLTITELAVNNSTLDIAGNQLSWQSFSTGIEAWGSKVQLNEPHWQSVTLQLAGQANNQGSAADSTFSYQPLALTDFSLPLSLFVDRFKLTDFTLQQQDNVQQLNALQFSLQWQKQQLDLLQLDVHHPQINAHGSARVTTQNTYPLQVALQLQLTDGEFSGQQLHLELSGDAADLQLQANASGLVTASASANVNLLQANLPHQLRLQSESLQWPANAEQPQLQLSRTYFSASGDIEQSVFNGRTSIAPQNAPEAAAEFSGYVGLNGITLERLLLDTLGGQLALTATADWREAISWNGEIALRDIQPGTFWQQYSGTLNGKLQHSGQLSNDNSWQVDVSQLSLQGDLRDYALDLNGTLQLADQTGQGDYRLSTEGLNIRHADNTVSVQGSLEQQWNLIVKADIPALGQTLPGAKGALNGEFRITGSQLQPELNGELSANKLKWQQYQLEQLSTTAKVWFDSSNTINTSINLDASNALLQQQQLQKLQLTLDGNEHQHTLTLMLDSKQHQANLELSGALEQRQLWQGQLRSAQLNSLLGSWQLAQPAKMQFNVSNSQFDLAAHCWQQQASNICLSKPLTASNKQLNAAIDVTQFDLAALAQLIPGQFVISGQANASVTANWQQGQLPQATLTISSEKGELTQQQELPLVLRWQQLSLNSKLADDNLQSSLNLALSDETTLEAIANISALQSDDRQLKGNIKLNRFALNLLQPLLGEFSELQGELSSDLALAGDLEQPIVNGLLDITDVRVKGRQAPVDIDDADIRLTLSGQQAELTGLVTTTRGEIKLSGEANWQQLTDWHARVKITGDELRLQVPQARLSVAPDLTLKATPQLTSLSGTVTVPVANINIDSLPQNAVELSNDLVLLDSDLKPIPQEEKAVFAFETDLNVVLGNRVRLSAMGLKALLKGKLRVRQQPGSPLMLNGDVTLQDGTFRAYGQDLLIRTGKMNFNGPADQPFLNIEAIRNPDNMEDDVVAGIRVTGPADEPNVTIFSEPSKAQANALSYLIMGRDIDSSGGNTGNAVTTSLLGMTLASSNKAVGEIGEAFGLQDLTLDTAGSGDNSQVTVSGYLSRDLQLKYGYGIFNAVGEFTLRYRLMRRLYLEAVSGLDNAVDLLYKFEFD